MSVPVPQVLIHQDFQTVPAEITDPLRAHISGGHAQLVRHAVAAEKPLGALGGYISGVSTAYTWPNKSAGGLIDSTYTKLFIDDAQLLYFSDLIGTGQTVAPVSGRPDRIRIDGSTGFKVNGAHDRLAGLYNRDVQIGDIVSVRATVSTVSHSLVTYVKDIIGDAVAAVTGALANDAANAASQSASVVVTQTAGTVNTMTVQSNASAYDGLGDGSINETYTVTVISGSTAGNTSTALIRVTSSTGLDDFGTVVPDVVDAYFAIGVRGLTIRFHPSSGTPDLIPGQTWTVAVHQLFAATVATSGGTYTGTVDDTYLVEVVRGGLLADLDPTLVPQVRVTTVRGLDISGPTSIIADATAYAIGVNGITFTVASGTTALCKGDRFSIAVTAATVGRMGTIALGQNLPAALVAVADLDLKLYVEKSYEVDFRRLGYEPTVNWSQTADAITVTDGLIAYDSAFLDGSSAQRPLTVESGDLTVEYRAWLPDLADSVGTITDVANIDDAISGALDPDNPLKWGVKNALANSNGTAVAFTSVVDPATPASWLDTLSVLVGRTGVYGLVPLTRDTTVLTAYAAHAASQSSPDKARFRVLWGTVEARPQIAVVSSATSSDLGVVLATIGDDPATTGTQYTKITVPAGNGDFVVKGVRAGDLVRFFFTTSFGIPSYTTYTVASVVNEDSLVLTAGPAAAVTVAQKLEVWRSLTKAEQAADIASRVAVYADHRVRIIWPDSVGSGGTLQPSYFLAAALAGLRSGVVPQRGLTNAVIAGFDSVTRSTPYFNSDQLDVIAAGGAWIVHKLPTGEIVTRHALTTKVADLSRRSEMRVSNLDSISFVYYNRLAPYIGQANVTASFLSLLRVQLDSIKSFLQSNGFVPELGGQINDAVISALRVHPILKDRVLVVVNLDLPYELNNVELHLVV